ncbi:MAG: hypothetical protein GPOALKHO_001713 [Sodalis sp.]|nr:MAG: hypothetical protein GPOALKHO_001713 [Sodalis sp.]
MLWSFMAVSSLDSCTWTPLTVDRLAALVVSAYHAVAAGSARLVGVRPHRHRLSSERLFTPSARFFSAMHRTPLRRRVFSLPCTVHHSFRQPYTAGDILAVTADAADPRRGADYVTLVQA